MNGLKLCLLSRSIQRVSDQYICIIIIYIEKGRTLQLLKQSSKPVTVGRKRKKFEPAGSLDDYKKAVVEENESIQDIIKEGVTKPEFNLIDTLGGTPPPK